MSSEDLIEDIKLGRKDALDNLVDEYGKLIYGVIASVMLPNNMGDEIDECFNDILLTIWFKIESFDLNKGNIKMGYFRFFAKKDKYDEIRMSSNWLLYYLLQGRFDVYLTSENKSHIIKTLDKILKNKTN